MPGDGRASPYLAHGKEEGLLERKSSVRLAAYRAHTVVVGGVWGPLCPWCGGWVLAADFQAHEAIVGTSKRHDELIFVVENIVPIHPLCHIAYGNTLTMKRLCLKRLLLNVGSAKVGTWYTSLWQQHGLSVPRGLLVPRSDVPLAGALHMMGWGAKLRGRDVPDDAAGVRGLVHLSWAGKKLNRKVVQLQKVAAETGAPVLEMRDWLEDGYWLEYFSGVIGASVQGVLDTPVQSVV